MLLIANFPFGNPKTKVPLKSGFRVVFFDKAKTDRNESGRWMISCTQRLQKLRKKMDVSDLINGWATLHGTGVYLPTWKVDFFNGSVYTIHGSYGFGFQPLVFLGVGS